MELPRGYQLDEERGAGVAFARTADGERVVIKELVLGRVADWKEVELFEREVETLRQLRHPAIPPLIEDVRGEGETPNYYLVAAWVDGESLESLAETTDENRLKSVARRVLEVLLYLQSFSPPVLHRNITPEAIIVRANDELSLVDFGAVQVELHATMGGSTMVGTSGYMAPEQLLGRAEPSSDLYSLGATLIRVITGLEPAELPLDRMRLQWRNHARFGSERFLEWVDRMVCPEPSGRFVRADDALRALGGESLMPALRGEDMLASRPPTTQVQFSRRPGRLSLQVPPESLVNRASLGFVGSTLGALLLMFGVGSTLGWVVGAIFALAATVQAVDIVRTWSQRRGSELELDVDRGFRLRRGKQLRTGSLDDVIGLETGFGGRRDSLWMTTRQKMVPIGRGLRAEEQAWLCDEIEAFLGEELHRTRPRRNVEQWLQQKLSR